MAKIASSKSVPKGMQATYEAITTLTDAFCRDHLSDEYRELAQRMTAALCQLAVFVVQVITTECVCKGRNGLVGRLHALGHGLRGCDFSHA